MNRLLFGCLVLLLLLPLSLSASTLLVLAPVVTLKDERVSLDRLGDWSTSLPGSHLQLENKMLTFPNELISQEGRSWISRQVVQALLQEQYPTWDITLRGADQILIRKPRIPQSVSPIVEAASDQLLSDLLKIYSHVELTPLGVLKDASIQGTIKTLTASRFREGRAGKREAVRVTLETTEGQRVVVPVWFSVKIPAEVMMLESSAAALTHLRDLSLIPQQADIAGLRGDIEWPSEEYRLNKPLPSGHLLTLADLEPIPDIEKGSVVRIISQAGSTVIHAQGHALEDGGQGESIAFLVKGSQKPAMGKVINKGIILVKEDRNDR
ncbi:flagella basal body P-ring formation protein FlgA [Parendozoicomonas haliclonae]|uniref:Flagellar basal body P-ring biosynthesis protein FlgA n=1 Tax=Parendozoicomonas haliclonae TaxID=1960125 RepID=A0A1X7ANK8_9GAMM|nr:flagella basal body P-ring formation protein FlgA [Parendozoicomonas haliclonae]SMA49876.1 flagellar basal body P-ring biosynthesis protein FlgA [Parendozoicomonas haliclonae]